ncbi:hypothetical protein L0222_29770 [bacterium]|nr:hypothetical protein [bacterium]
MLHFFITSILLLMLAGSLFAQADPHAACADAPVYVPAGLLERDVPLRSGIGNSSEKVTTSSEKAQKYYDQGLNYLESYVWIEASRSFHEAIRLDANLAMAYVGLSRVHSGLNDPDGAKRFLEKAKTFESTICDRERRRIAIRAKQLFALDALEDPAKHADYKKEIDSALAFDFNDPQLWLLRANAEEPNASGRGQRGTSSSIAFYEMVLKLMPDHASAHHYLVHSYETINRIDKALEHGEKYAHLSPSIPHAVHMWAHDLRRVGRIDEAIVQFKKADSLERAYYQEEKIDPSKDWHHGHNLDLLAQCYQHKGQMKLAEQTMRDSWSLEAIDGTRAFAMRELPNFLIHQGRYDEALSESRRLTEMPFAPARAVGHALMGQALIRLKRLDKATEALQHAEKELESIPKITAGILPNRFALQPWVDTLRGELLLTNGKQREGRILLEKVQRTMRAIPGADAWSQTLFQLESIAHNARETGNWELAEFTAQQMLDHDSAYGGSHLAMAFVRQHQGRDSDAAEALEQAKRLWKDADPDFLKNIATKVATTSPGKTNSSSYAGW